MKRGATRQKRVALRRWVSHLLLLAFFARALVPAGYMQDFSAASEGIFKVVICTAGGAKTLTIDDSGRPRLDQQDGHHDDQPCPFGGMAAIVLPALEAIQIGTQEFENSNLSPRLSVQLPPTRAGPQLGSRGPPQIV